MKAYKLKSLILFSAFVLSALVAYTLETTDYFSDREARLEVKPAQDDPSEKAV